MKRTGWVFLLLLFTPALYAFDVTVLRSFTISGLTRANGKLTLPLEHKQYYNIRVLNKETYDFLLSCKEPCVQLQADVTASVVEVRCAQTRKHMWIVQVAFGRAWLVTFLVFQKGNNFSIKEPEHFTFMSKELAEQTRHVILQSLRQEDI